MSRSLTIQIVPDENSEKKFQVYVNFVATVNGQLTGGDVTKTETFVTTDAGTHVIQEDSSSGTPQVRVTSSDTGSTNDRALAAIRAEFQWAASHLPSIGDGNDPPDP